MAQRKKTGNRNGNNRSKKKEQPQKKVNRDLSIIIALVVAVVLELCNFGVFGIVGGWIKYFFFGLIGAMSYIFPLVVFAAVVYINISRRNHKKDLICSGISFLCICSLIQLITQPGFENGPILDTFKNCAENSTGGGFMGALLGVALIKLLSRVGAYIFLIVIILVCLVLISEFPFLSIFNGLSEKRELKRNERRNAGEYDDEEDADDIDEEPDKVVRPFRSHNKNSRDEVVYEGVDDEARVIRIVHTPSKNKYRRAELNRLEKKASPMRDGASQQKIYTLAKGVSGDTTIIETNAGGDEIHEITRQGFRTEEEKKYSEAENYVKVSFDSESDPKFNLAKEKGPKPEPVKPVSEKKEKPVSRKTAVKATAVKATEDPDGYKFPPLEFLAKKKASSANGSKNEQDQIAKKLEMVLEEYGVHAKVINKEIGPSVTRYELQPEMGTRVNKVTSLVDEIKLYLAVPDVRIEAPIPGKDAIGIEISNSIRETVTMRELIEAPALKKNESKIAFAAGVDISGNVIVADIAKMPHLLVAGTTGSGKSTFINTILMAILYRAKPSEVGLLVIDPKKIEFGVYSGIPHLIKDVVTDAGQAVSTLRWAVNEMESRYQRMQLSGVRDFKSYNNKLENGLISEDEENPKKMPQIVIIIDELADLMQTASKEAEALICRLAQLARAAGIHLIIATQRPSVDVVTGLIKANIPSRVALLVASQVDSRTIIDMKGAEELLGYGDMLFNPTGAIKPIRVQGAFVSDTEVGDVVDFLVKNNHHNYFESEAAELQGYLDNSDKGSSDQGRGGSAKEESEDQYDEYIFEAGMACINSGKASSSMLQRRFSIGFNRAARIIDQLCELGVVGPQNGAKPREILVDAYTFEMMMQTKDE